MGVGTQSQRLGQEEILRRIPHPSILRHGAGDSDGEMCIDYAQCFLNARPYVLICGKRFEVPEAYLKGIEGRFEQPTIYSRAGTLPCEGYP